jgi:hypothetical protein
MIVFRDEILMLCMSRVAAPLGLGQGLTRLLQFSGQLSNENHLVSSLPRLLSTFPLTLILPRIL